MSESTANILRDRFPFMSPTALAELAEEIDVVLHPRIETVEQLDALPDGSIVMDCHGTPVSKVEGIWWYGSARARVVPPYGFPARVLYTPGIV